ncbi:Aly2p [Sugiyamaella lignohabitans]|uniref:Aly2p n=1 Tax=Sugiyamaella lignohabitans TaxID=796027 RepID=A0A167FT88_9ASCO|nr:Aly2p [Sugiyamaella lignohabitans]ANB15675.1 Aly2p [Sugiyamaella lignohabitans]
MPSSHTPTIQYPGDEDMTTPKPNLLNSPIFPSASFTSESTINAPENQITSSGGVSLSIVLAEPVIFLQGFNETEYVEETPAMLRGSLIVTTSKPTKIKAITLTFKGHARTEWPEGIPPKRAETYESQDVHCHVWSFFNASYAMAEYSSGAHLVRYAKDFGSSAVSSFSRDASPSGMRPRSSSNNSLSRPEGLRGRTSTDSFEGAASTLSAATGIKGLANRFRRAASPAPSMPSSQTFSGLALGPHRSFSKTEAQDHDIHAKGYRIFEPGEYIYNFELALPQSLPETIRANFGSVIYDLEAIIERPGTFKSNISGTKEVTVVRAMSDNNLEATEPIAISRDWEDQLHYDIVIAGKCFPMGTEIPIAFKFTPLAKMKLHRIRVYITENAEYYCKNKKVHRIEPTKKFLIKEFLPDDGISGSLLGDFHGVELESVSEMEYEVKIPMSFSNVKEHLHPNTAYENIEIHHWIKLVLRLSKIDPDATDKRKFYEISIDSPISLLDNHCTNANILLPQYIPRRSSLVSTSSSSTLPTPMPSTSQRAPQRPIHFLRKPSVAPPPFDAEVSPPSIEDRPDAPPSYEAVIQEEEAEAEDMTRPVMNQLTNFRLGSNSSTNSGGSSSSTSSASATSNLTNTDSYDSTSGSSTTSHQQQYYSNGASTNSAHSLSNNSDSSSVRSSSTVTDRASTSSAQGTSRTSMSSVSDTAEPVAFSGVQASVPQIPQLGRHESVASSVDIADQDQESLYSTNYDDDGVDPMDHSSPRIPHISLDVPPESEEDDEGHTNIPSNDRFGRSLYRMPTANSSSSTAGYGRRSSSTPSTMINPGALPGEVYPLLGHRPSLKDGSELSPMDSAGDIGSLTLTGDFDDAASLQSTPSLWIS